MNLSNRILELKKSNILFHIKRYVIENGLYAPIYEQYFNVELLTKEMYDEIFKIINKYKSKKLNKFIETLKIDKDNEEIKYYSDFNILDDLFNFGKMFLSGFSEEMLNNIDGHTDIPSRYEIYGIELFKIVYEYWIEELGFTLAMLEEIDKYLDDNIFCNMKYFNRDVIISDIISSFNKMIKRHGVENVQEYIKEYYGEEEFRDVGHETGKSWIDSISDTLCDSWNITDCLDTDTLDEIFICVPMIEEGQFERRDGLFKKLFKLKYGLK